MCLCLDLVRGSRNSWRTRETTPEILIASGVTVRGGKQPRVVDSAPGCSPRIRLRRWLRVSGGAHGKSIYLERSGAT